MAQDEWTVPQMHTAEPLTPPTTPSYGSAGPWITPPPSPPQMTYELRPLSLGEVLDRTFALFRERFWLFAGIAALTGALTLAVGLLQVVMQYGVLHRQIWLTVVSAFGFLAGAIAQLVGIAITYAALVYALGEVYLGKPTDALTSLKSVLPRWYRYTGIVIWHLWSAIWVGALLFLPGFILIGVAAAASGSQTAAAAGGILLFVGILGGVVYGVIAYIRNSLAIAASVIEQLPARASMRRSKNLAAGTKGRIFVVYLIGFALSLAVGTADIPAFVMFFKARGEMHVFPMIWLQVVSAIGQTIITPIMLIGLALVYFDQRVRKEALDLVMMMGATAPPVPPPPPQPYPSAPYAAPLAEVPTEPSPEPPATETPATQPVTEAPPTDDAGSL